MLASPSVKPAETEELFGIAELADEFDVSARTLRFYEAKQLLSPERINGARIYTRRDRARLALILRAKALGSTLAEIGQYLDMYGDHGEGRTKQLRYVVERTDIAIRELEQKRAQLELSLTELRAINAACKKQLADRKRR